MMKLLFSILFSFLLGITNGSALLGSTECTYGPSYWCHNLQHAKQCGAVTHCIQTVWEHLELPEDNDSICDICKDMVQQARDVLQSNETQAELKQVFDGACILIPIKSVSNECVVLANDFVPELIETLSSQMNPNVVCATAGLCNNAKVDKLLIQHGLLPEPKPLETQTSAVAVQNECSDCDNFIGELVANIKHHSKKDLMNHLLSICGELGSLSDGCSSLVIVNIDTIYNYLTNDIDPSQVCSMFGMCSAKLDYKKMMNKDKNEVCDFCIVIAQHWRDEMASKTDREEFKKVLEGICKQTGKFEVECLALVDTYAMDLYDTIINDFHPKAVCEMLGLCSSDSKFPLWTVLHTGPEPANAEIDANFEYRNSAQSLHFVGTDEANSYKRPIPNIKVTVAGASGVLNQSEPSSSNDEVCVICQFALHFIQVELQNKQTRDEIEAAVRNVCNYFPNDLKEQCQDYVDAYGDQVIALLQQEIDPTIICPAIGLCPKKAGSSIEIPKKSDVTCVVCEFIMKKFKQLIGDKTNEEAVKSALDEVCSKLPNTFSDQCITFVDQNAIEVMELISVGVNPQEICKMLNFCSDQPTTPAPLNEENQLPIGRLFLPQLSVQSAPAVPEQREELEKKGQGKVCILCEMVMLALEKLVQDNSTQIEDEIKSALDAVCLHLPSTIQEDCIGFVDQYSTAIIELLIHEFSPKIVCRTIRLCKATSLDAMAVMASETPIPKERSCLICKAVVRAQMSDLSEDVFTELCGELPLLEQNLCESLATKEWNQFLHQSRQCISAGHCEERRTLIGSDRCTWGPSYWCQSKLHAHSCGAISHCVSRVWMGNSPA